MPFLKCNRKNQWFEQKIKKSKRNGFRFGVYSTHKHPKDKYSGNYKDDKKEGYGREVTRNGYTYDGNWKNDLKEGFGILSKTENDGLPKKLYAGCWVAGQRQGYGIAWYPHSVYKGFFCKNKRQGFGKMFWDDKSYYEGYWENNLFHGYGLYRSSNGNEYRGQFFEGFKEGKGTYYHVNTGQIQPGIWCRDSCVSGHIEDSAPLRQVAITPTYYPIPPILNKYSVKREEDCFRSQFKLYPKETFDFEKLYL